VRDPSSEFSFYENENRESSKFIKIKDFLIIGKEEQHQQEASRHQVLEPFFWTWFEQGFDKLS